LDVARSTDSGATWSTPATAASWATDLGDEPGQFAPGAWLVPTSAGYAIAPRGTREILTSTDGLSWAHTTSAAYYSPLGSADGASFVSALGSVFSRTVDDTVAPSASISTPPQNPTRVAGQQIGVTVGDALSHKLATTCRLDGGTNLCSGTKTIPQGQTSTSFSVPVQPSQPGLHTLAVTVTDEGGNSAQVSTTWRYDPVAPTAAVSPFSSPATLGSSPVRWTGSDSGAGIASYDLRYQRAAYNGPFGSWVAPTSWLGLKTTSLTVPLPVGYAECFSVRARDKAGNVGAWSPRQCQVRPLDDRALVASSGWSRGTGTTSAYYAGTFTSTSKLSATLTRSSAYRVTRVGVLATTCSSCGSLDVYIGGLYRGRLSLTSSITRYEQLRWIAVGSARSGSVVLKAVTSGRLLRIDGLAVVPF
jgi:hypothetical protein